MDFNTAIEHILADKLLMYATPVFLLLLVIEYWIDKRQRLGLYQNKDMFISMTMGILSLIVEFLPKVIFYISFFYIYQSDFLGLNDLMSRSNWWSWAILIIADDFSYYWFHRMNHEVRLFWAGHVSHHSSVHMNFGTALRQGVGERLHKYIFWIWIPFLGFHPTMIFVAMSINLIYQYGTHTEFIKKLPRAYEAIFNTPSHHRVHHASQARYLDRNHAGVLILWDKLFGTFSEEKDFDKPVYGLTNNLRSQGILHTATHEYAAIWKDVRRADKFSDKMKYIFYPPGWSHDGPDLRAKTLRKHIG